MLIEFNPNTVTVGTLLDIIDLISEHEEDFYLKHGMTSNAKYKYFLKKDVKGVCICSTNDLALYQNSERKIGISFTEIESFTC